MKGYTSKKVCDFLGRCKWITIKSKRQIPLEQSLKRMMEREGGNIKEEFIPIFYLILKKAESGKITSKDLEILNAIMRDTRKKKKKKSSL